MSRALLVFPFLGAVLGGSIVDRNELITDSIDEPLVGAQSLEIVPQIPNDFVPTPVFPSESGTHANQTSALNVAQTVKGGKMTTTLSTGKHEHEHEHDDTDEISEIDSETESFAENDEISTTISSRKTKTNDLSAITELPAQFVDIRNVVGITQKAEEIPQPAPSPMIIDNELPSFPPFPEQFHPTVAARDEMEMLEIFVRFLALFLMAVAESTENQISEITLQIPTTQMPMQTIDLAHIPPTTTTTTTTSTPLPVTLSPFIDRFVSFFAKAQSLTNCAMSHCQQVASSFVSSPQIALHSSKQSRVDGFNPRRRRRRRRRRHTCICPLQIDWENVFECVDFLLKRVL